MAIMETFRRVPVHQSLKTTAQALFPLVHQSLETDSEEFGLVAITWVAVMHRVFLNQMPAEALLLCHTMMDRLKSVENTVRTLSDDVRIGLFSCTVMCDKCLMDFV